MPADDRDLLSRRRFLQSGLTAAALLALPSRVLRAAGGQPRRLRLLNTHTLERADVVYDEGSGRVPEALSELDRLLRDHRSGEVHRIAPSVLDLAWELGRSVGLPDGEWEVISGYRSPSTNEALRALNGGVAKRSLHLEGRALDLRLPGVPTARLREAALELARGGVGYYPRSDFVHVDDGRVRRW